MITTTRETPTTCDECHVSIPAGDLVQVESIRSAFGGRYEDRLSHTDRSVCRHIKSERLAEQRAAYEARNAELATATEVRSLHASEKQIRFALDLQTRYWTPAVFGGRQFTNESLCAMSKTEVGRVIDALVDERSLQTA